MEFDFSEVSDEINSCGYSVAYVTDENCNTDIIIFTKDSSNKNITIAAPDKNTYMKRPIDEIANPDLIQRKLKVSYAQAKMIKEVLDKVEYQVEEQELSEKELKEEYYFKEGWKSIQ